MHLPLSAVRAKRSPRPVKTAPATPQPPATVEKGTLGKSGHAGKVSLTGGPYRDAAVYRSRGLPGVFEVSNLCGTIRLLQVKAWPLIVREML